MPTKLLIISLIGFLTSCSFFKKDNLEKFVDGEVAIWKYADGTISSQENDCSKVIENSNGVVVFQYVKDERLITFMHWGKKTTDSKYFGDLPTRNIFGKDAGWTNYFKISGSKRSGDSLIVTAIRDDGLISDNYFSTSDGVNLYASGWSYSNADQKQMRQYNMLKDQILKKQAVEVCKVSTLIEYVNKSEAFNKKLPDAHLYLGSRLIDLVPDDAAVNPLPNSLDKAIFECLTNKNDEQITTTASNCPITKVSPTYKLRAGETFSIFAITPRCCLSTVEISSNQLTYEEPLDIFKNLPGVEKKQVECKELSDKEPSTQFFEILKDGSQKFSVREILSGGSGGYNTYTTIYYGMPKINCSAISNFDRTEQEARSSRR